MCPEDHRLTPAQKPKLPLVVILGPTAVGKTQVSLLVASRLSAEIVSADSRLLYTGMDIGTAKPTIEERRLVPHHLIDVATPDQVWSLAQYQAAASAAITAIHQRNRLPILVGGTGQYIHALTQGWEIPPAAPDLALRQALERWGAQIGALALHRRLAILDAQAAATIDPANIRRTIRALEVIFTTGQRFSAQRRRNAPPYAILQVGIMRSRAELYQRVDERIEQMIQAGFLAEVQSLLEQGYASNLPTMSAIGYGEIAGYLSSACSLDEAILQIKRRTRIFIRRQANWFKPDGPAIHWISANDDTATQAEQIIAQWLKTNPSQG